jgi:hypothetical protein
MPPVSDLSVTDVEQYLHAHEQKTLLRFITCGSVDDGKSSLIGRLLFECKTIFEDQLSALEADSKRVGTRGEEIDFALLVDGLAAEREQGITIDVAYRFFSTGGRNRAFGVAGAPMGDSRTGCDNSPAAKPRPGRARFRDQSAVFQDDASRAFLRERRLVGDEYDRDSASGEATEEVHDDAAVRRVEVAGSFVGQDRAGPVR